MTEQERRAEEKKEKLEQAAREYMGKWRDLAVMAHGVRLFDQLHPVDAVHYMRRAEEYFRIIAKLETLNPIKDHSMRDYNTQMRNKITREFVQLLKRQQEND